MTTTINVASSPAGARVLFCTDEWFAAADALLNDGVEPTFDPLLYCDQGKVMDGWESRRRRRPGHDWCLLELACRATLVAVTFDTAFFTGNQAPAVSLSSVDLSSAATAFPQQQQQQPQPHGEETDPRMQLAAHLPGVLERLIRRGGLRGTGMTLEDNHAAERALDPFQWTEILPRTPLQPGHPDTRLHANIPLVQTTATHVRLNYYPDGGVARMAIWGIPVAAEEDTPPSSHPSASLAVSLYRPLPPGMTTSSTAAVAGTLEQPSGTLVVYHYSQQQEREVQEQQQTLPSQQPCDWPELSCSNQGGLGLACSNQHYGVPDNLIQLSLGRDMGDGWETARHPHRPGILVLSPETGLVDWSSTLSDWCILQLARPGANGVRRIIVDTKHFKGNYPESVQIEGCFLPDEKLPSPKVNDDPIAINPANSTTEWFPLLTRAGLFPDAEHCYDTHILHNCTRPVSHVRVTMYPDGGLSRVRIYGPPLLEPII